MKILHTSDWHLGKQLQKIDFEEDLNLFFEWLLSTIKLEQIDVLLMSGDLFDQANPSQAALNQYYRFLSSSIPTGCKFIITGGNHDSAAVLNAPKSLLHQLDISVIGGACENLEDVFLVIEKKNEKIVVAAIPFLKEKDIRLATESESYADKIEKIKEGLGNYFKKVNSYYSANYTKIPFIVMAHLYVQGVESSESEREIQIGNQAGVSSTIFGKIPHYVALGHIHKPQTVGGSEHIRYSGSPISLSFSEREDKKQIVIIETENENLKSIKTINIPTFRKLISVSGTLKEIKQTLEKNNTYNLLPTLIEIIVEEEHYSSTLLCEVSDLVMDQPYEFLKIVKQKVVFKNQLRKTGQLLEPNAQLSDFTTTQLFEKRLDQEPDIENKEELLLAFKELLENMHNN